MSTRKLHNSCRKNSRLSLTTINNFALVLIRAGYSLKFRWGGFSNREAVRWGKGGAGRAKRAEKFFPPHLKNPRPMGRGFFQMGRGISSFSYEKNGKTGFVPVNFVIHHLSISQLTEISFNSILKAFRKMFRSIINFTAYLS